MLNAFSDGNIRMSPGTVLAGVRVISGQTVRCRLLAGDLTQMAGEYVQAQSSNRLNCSQMRRICRVLLCDMQASDGACSPVFRICLSAAYRRDNTGIKERSRVVTAGVPGANYPEAIRPTDFESNIAYFRADVKWERGGKHSIESKNKISCN